MSDKTVVSASSQATYTRVNLWWTLAAFTPALALSIFGSPLLDDGSAEIMGIMLTSTLLMIRVFWLHRARFWFLALLGCWTMVHLCLFGLLVVPMKVKPSGWLLNLVWPEIFAFAALASVAYRWGGGNTKAR